METILTHQSAQYQGADVLVIDGEKSIFADSKEQVEALSLVKNVSREENLKVIPLLCKSEGTSKSFRVFLSDQNKMVFSSSFLSCDEKGRRVSYSFYCDATENPSRVVRLLQDYSRIAGMELNPSDCKTLEQFLTFYPKRRLAYTLTGGAALILLYLFCKIVF